MSNPFYISYAALWLLVVLQSLVLLGLVRIVYQLQQGSAVTGLGPMNLESGQKAPLFNATDLSGTAVRSTDFAGRLTALLFVSPTCQSCTTTLAEMKALNHKVDGNVVVICRAKHEECVQLAERYELDVPTIADEEEHLSQLFGISLVPTAILINSNNRIQSYGNPVRGEELEQMMKQQEAPEAILEVAS